MSTTYGVPDGGRMRGNSNPTRYVPDNYLPSATGPSDGVMMPPAGAPPNAGNAGQAPPAWNPAPQNQLAVPPGGPPYPTNNVRPPLGYQTGSHTSGRYPDSRRHSHSSTHSHRSDRSYRSHLSDNHNSHNRHRSYSDAHHRPHHHHHHSHHHDRDDYNRDGRRHSTQYDDRSHHHHDHHYDDDDDDDCGKPLKRKTSARPTLGDTVVTMWDYVKDALGPRDKY